MWQIKQIFDGDYGCEEIEPGAKTKVSVTLEDENGELKYISIEDEWLTENHLDEGSVWPEIIPEVCYGRYNTSGTSVSDI